ncbi:uncharacterized protein EI90DRAFT_2976883 [Cantharellus anzutake]|uniref:uncharacterized protein n=1 Tax=Cantharellus anzutake TaxID=1750568 RepID=UPI0019088A4E|nr:uncharacterized protein EI90DRAFT_2976883 [Cantharellus anzutake]KAF8324713.1 hypothetical protein EI90DRAFT_2976883 [Cantharellus anzutake]
MRIKFTCSTFFQDRHNEAHEKERDRVRAEIMDNHRFQSFAKQRSNNCVKWHIAGHDYFWALSEILASARECIFILDWWLSPELYLRRPPAYYPEWRVDRLLLRKAREGVKIHIVVYKEVVPTMSMSSKHTKHALEDLHQNIAVMRHPDHIGTMDDVEFWSHHEKVVVVDNRRACIGGLDICFGRWDTTSHPLADAHPTEMYKTLFPGQDYNDARVADFKDVDHYVSNTISVLEQPRMPWQDVHMTLMGPAVLDISQHFIERWNEVKERKYKDDSRFEWLSLPHALDAASDEPVARHPFRDAWLARGRHYKQRWLGEDAPPEPEEGHGPHGTCDVQVVRSVCDWSMGTLTEHSIQNAYIELINEANHFIYIGAFYRFEGDTQRVRCLLNFRLSVWTENQFFISNTGDHGPVKNRIAEALVNRIVSAAKEGRKFRVIVVFPEVPSFTGPVDTTSIKTILAAQYRTINRGGHSILEEIKKAGFEPSDYISFYHLRTYDRINNSQQFISEMERNSRVTFDDAQVALARLWLGPREGQPEYKVKIRSVAPQQADFDAVGQMVSQDEIKEIRVPPTVEEAQETIARFQSGAPRADTAVSDSVNRHVQLDVTDLRREQWLGTAEEERNAYVSELLYIHTKLLIVDDRRVILGSANLNERSQKGNGDSEICLVVEDTDLIPSRMDGQHYMASRFAATLRRKLFRKHLGLIEPQECNGPNDPVTLFMRPTPIPQKDESQHPYNEFVIDPLDDEFYSQWTGIAQKNAEIFHDIFRPVPTNQVRTWEQLKNYLPKIQPCHVANDSLSLYEIKNRLAEVRGHLVTAPLDFLADERELTSDDSFDWRGLNPTLPIYI